MRLKRDSPGLKVTGGSNYLCKADVIRGGSGLLQGPYAVLPTELERGGALTLQPSAILLVLFV